jgi:hypothetical protein
MRPNTRRCFRRCRPCPCAPHTGECVNSGQAGLGGPCCSTFALRATTAPTRPAAAWHCGADTTFVFNSWTIGSWTIGDDLRAFWADPNLSHPYTRRESMFCRFCCGNLRVRRIAEVLVSLYGPPGCASLAQLTENPTFRELDIAEINTIGWIGSTHALLRQLVGCQVKGTT